MVIRILIELQLHLRKILLDTELRNTLKLPNFGAEKKIMFIKLCCKSFDTAGVKSWKKIMLKHQVQRKREN